MISGALPPLQCLRAFLAVAEHGNFTRAAESLGLTQTAVSHQIAQLETYLGAPVFVRQRPGVRLTALGHDLRPRIDAVLTDLGAALQAARRTRSARKITVSTIPEFGTRWLAPRLGSFFDTHPGVGVNLVMEYRRADLASGEVDAAIWLGAGPKGLHATALGLDEEFVVCAPALVPTLPKTQGLRAAPILRYAGARHTLLDWERWLSILHPTADGPRPIDISGGPVFDTFADMVAACQQGQGFALVRGSLVTAELAAGTLVRCFVEAMPSDLQYHLVTAQRPRADTALGQFCQWVLGQVATDNAMR